MSTDWQAAADRLRRDHIMDQTREDLDANRLRDIPIPMRILAVREAALRLFDADESLFEHRLRALITEALLLREKRDERDTVRIDVRNAA